MFEVRKWVSRRIKGPNWKCWLMCLLVPAVQMQSSREMNSSRCRVIKSNGLHNLNLRDLLSISVHSWGWKYDKPLLLSVWSGFWFNFLSSTDLVGISFKRNYQAPKESKLLFMELVVSNRDSHNGIYNKLTVTHGNSNLQDISKPSGLGEVALLKARSVENMYGWGSSIWVTKVRTTDTGELEWIRFNRFRENERITQIISTESTWYYTFKEGEMIHHELCRDGWFQ